MAFVLITLVIIVIAYIILLLTYDNSDPFIYFLNENDINYFINEDYHHYFTNLSKSDLHARHQSSKENYKKNIISNVYNLSNKERKIMKSYIKIAHSLLLQENRYLNESNINRIPWNIAVINDDILENGFAHTQDDIIFLSTLDLDKPESYLVETLVHEFIHIYQRKFPQCMHAYNIEKNIKFVRLSNNRDNIRANPDTDNRIYSLNGKHMMTQYNSEYPENINDCSNAEFEHPNEIMAYEISRQLVNKYFN